MENEKEKTVSFKKVFEITLYVYISVVMLSIVIGGITYLIVQSTIENKIKMEIEAKEKMDAIFNAASEETAKEKMDALFKAASKE
jgi:hypothetical protein